jgi:AraC-like DNA-binding protein
MHPDAKFRARVRQAAGGQFAVEIIGSWEELNQALGEVSPAALVVVDPYQGSGRQAQLSPELRGLLREFPSIAVLAAVETQAGRRQADLRTLGQWGVMEIILVGEDNPPAITRLLLAVRGRPLQSLLDRSLPADTSGRARSILNAAAEVAATGGQSEELARTLHVSMRTLLRWCESAGLPPPRQVLAWMRILLAAELLDHPGRSVEDVASACGYASDSGLRRVFSDFLGTNPRALRKGSAFAAASRAFRRALPESRRSSQKQVKLAGHAG